MNSGRKLRGWARSRIGRSHSSFHILPAIPRDYLARRKFFRTLSNVLMIVLFSLIVAAIIVYSSDPSAFPFLRH